MATIPVFRTWVAGEVVTAAYFNSNVRDAGNFFLSWPVCEARQTVAQSIATSTSVDITFDTNDIDTDTAHSTTVNNNRYTAKTTGRFQISGGTSFVSHADSNSRHAEIWKNGAAVSGAAVAVAGFSATSARIPTKTITMFANGTTDYFTISAFQTSGVALNTGIGGVEQPTMSIRMVGTT